MILLPYRIRLCSTGLGREFIRSRGRSVIANSAQQGRQFCRNQGPVKPIYQASKMLTASIIHRVDLRLRYSTKSTAKSDYCPLTLRSSEMRGANGYLRRSAFQWSEPRMSQDRNVPIGPYTTGPPIDRAAQARKALVSTAAWRFIRHKVNASRRSDVKPALCQTPAIRSLLLVGTK